jgi:hypothetical protein
MRKSWLVCVFLGTLAWGQAAGTPPPAQPGQNPAPMAGMQQAPAAPPDLSASVPPEEAVITVKGVCPAKAPAAKGTAEKPAAATTAKTPAADCKTVITKAEFEKLASGVAPNMTPQLRRQLASVLPRLIAMSDAAKKKGLDKTPRYEETIKFARMQILTNELNRQIQEEAAKVPAEDIAAYYKKNPEAFEQFNLDRLFVPRSKQGDADSKEDEDKDEKLSDEAKKAKEAADKAKADEGEQAMTKLADSLRERAAAGEDFVKLQKEAFDAAGMKIESPTVNLPKVRRTGLPPGHSAVFDLKTGDVSQVINDTGGHYIYKVISKDQLTLDQAKDEIHSTLQNQRNRDMTDAVQKSFTVDTNEKYFGPAGPAGNMMPPKRLPNPRMPPSPTTPQAQPQTPPPASKPN